MEELEKLRIWGLLTLGFRVQGLGFRVSGLGFGVQGLGAGLRVGTGLAGVGSRF